MTGGLLKNQFFFQLFRKYREFITFDPLNSKVITKFIIRNAPESLRIIHLYST